MDLGSAQCGLERRKHWILAMETIGDDHIKALLEAALADCSSETVRLVRPLLHLPVVQHMLHVFLMDQSR